MNLTMQLQLRLEEQGVTFFKEPDTGKWASQFASEIVVRDFELSVCVWETAKALGEDV